MKFYGKAGKIYLMENTENGGKVYIMDKEDFDVLIPESVNFRR